MLLQKSTPPEDTGQKIPHCSFSKQHCPVCQSQICNQASRDTVDGQLVSVGPLIRSKLETHVHEQTWATPFLSVAVRDRKSLSLFLHLFHTHTDTTVLSSQLSFQMRFSGTVKLFCGIEEFLMKLLCARPSGSARDEAGWLTHDCIITDNKILAQARKLFSHYHST